MMVGRKLRRKNWTAIFLVRSNVGRLLTRRCRRNQAGRQAGGGLFRLDAWEYGTCHAPARTHRAAQAVDGVVQRLQVVAGWWVAREGGGRRRRVRTCMIRGR